MHSWVTQECREGRVRVGSGSECTEGGEDEVGDGREIGREDGEAAAVVDGGSADGKSRRGHQTDVPYSGAKAATWSSMRGTSGTSTPARGPDCFRVGSLRRDESGVDLGCVDWAWCLVGRVAWSCPGGQKVPSDSVRDPSTCFACLVLSRSCSCPVLSWPVPPGAEGQSLTAAVLRGAARLQVLETECFEACLDDPDNPGSRFWVVWRSVAWESGTGSQLSQLQGEASAIGLFLGLVVGILCV